MRSMARIPASWNGVWSSRTAPSRSPARGTPGSCRPAGHPRAGALPQGRVGVRLARDRQVACAATKSTRTMGPRASPPCARRGRRGCRHVRRAGSRSVSRGSPRRRRTRSGSLRSQGVAAVGAGRARSLEHRGRPEGAVVGADEAGEVLGVVVRPHEDLPCPRPGMRGRPRCAGRRAAASKRPPGICAAQAVGQDLVTRPSRPCAAQGPPGRAGRGRRARRRTG